jgi:ATP-binding cassette subfamily B protein
MSDLGAWVWPIERLGEALEALARSAGLHLAGTIASTAPAFGPETPRDVIVGWIDQACQQLGLEIESVDASGAEYLKMLRHAGPALLHYRLARPHGVLLLLRASRRSACLLAPDLQVRKVGLEALRAALCADFERPVAAEVEATLREAGVAERHWPGVGRCLVQQRLAAQRFTGCWMLRQPPEGSFGKQLLQARVPRRVLGMVAVFAVLYVLEIAGWTLIGRGALGGRLDTGWLLAWGLLLLASVPMRATGNWLQGTLAIDAGVLLKQRLLAGALRMDVHALRRQGSAQLLSRVIESEALESLSLHGGFAALLALVELSLAAWVLAQGAGGPWHAAMMLLWLAGTLLVARYYHARLFGWTRLRLELTHDLIERMVGHRTRMVQKAPQHWHEDEDQQVERYAGRSRELDRWSVGVIAGLPRGWVLFGLLGLAPAFITGTAQPTAMAIALGGVLLAYRALSAVVAGLSVLLRAAVAADAIAPLLAAAAKPQPAAGWMGDAPGSAPSKVLLQARNLVFRHQARSEAVLTGCDLTIQRGDRLLLEGASGGGKSTLAALLVGLQAPESGLLLLDGLDRITLGDAWRQRSTAAPQFHENHVLSGSLAFNLLMGRRWPASDSDMAEAEQLCRDLGLGALLDRMPAGLMQMVGETGWQLSHGERSRLFLARALLQKTELVVLDESFASLDPETLDRCVRCALARAPTLLVIAHP